MLLIAIPPLLRRIASVCFLAFAAFVFAAPLLSGLAQSENRPLVVTGEIDGTITPVMAGYVERVIDRAERDGAALVVFEMDTPGGLMSAMDDIVRDILESEVPVAVYVAPRGARAASAGVFITYAAHVAAMAPGTNIGSASPVLAGDGGESEMSDTMTRKVTNDAVAQIKNLAQLRGRNAEWAEQAVRDAVNVTADEALGLGVIDVMADDLPGLLAQIDGRTVQLATGSFTLETTDAQVRSVDMGAFEQLLQLISDPTIAYLMISLGLLGIYVEISNPGITVPGIAGAIAVLLGFFSLGTISVNWAGILLMVLAFILFAVDLYVPSLGMLTVGGLVAFVLGSYLLVGDEAPPGYEINPVVIWTMTACLLAFSLFLGAMVLKARLRPPATGREVLIGSLGIVRQTLAPQGSVFVAGERWEASLAAGDGRAEAGTKVIVERVDGLHLYVRPATESEIAEREQNAVDRRRVIPAGGRPEPSVTGTSTQSIG